MTSPILPGASNPVILDLSLHGGNNVELSFEVSRNADINNRVGFYKVLDTDGSVVVDGRSVRPGHVDYIRAATVSSNILFADSSPVILEGKNGSVTYSSYTVKGGGLWTPYSLNVHNPNSLTEYTSWPSTNPGNFPNFIHNGTNGFALEDYPFGGDQDYDDLVVTYNVDDISQPSYYSLSDSKVLEGDVAEVIIFRSGDLGSPQTLRLQSFGGTARLGVDYDKVDEVIQFSANQDTYTSLIPTKSDSRFESSEFVSLRLSPFGSSSQSDNPPNITRSIGHLTILDADDDGPSFSSFGYDDSSVAVSGGLRASDSSSLALGIPSFASTPVVLSSPIVASDFFSPVLASPNLQTIAISGGIGASSGSSIQLASDPIALGLSSNISLEPFAVPVSFRPAYSVVHYDDPLAVDLRHIPINQPLFVLGASAVSSSLPNNIVPTNHQVFSSVGEIH